MNNYYVYILLNPEKPGNYKYGDFTFYFEPFYVGYGKGNRVKQHYMQCYMIKKRNKNTKKTNLIKYLNEKGYEPKYIINKEHMSIEDAIGMEIHTILTIGREIDGGPLMNKSRGGERSINFCKKPIGEYNKHLELIRIYESIVDASEDIGMIIPPHKIINPNFLVNGSFWRYLDDINNPKPFIDDVTITNSEIERRIKMGRTNSSRIKMDRTIHVFDKNGDHIKQIIGRKNLVSAYGKRQQISSTRLILTKIGLFFVYGYLLKNEKQNNLFKYHNLKFENNSQKKNKDNEKKCCQINLENNTITKHDSIHAAQKAGLSGIIKGEYKISKGYMWLLEHNINNLKKYLEDYNTHIVTGKHTKIRNKITGEIIEFSSLRRLASYIGYSCPIKEKIEASKAFKNYEFV